MIFFFWHKSGPPTGNCHQSFALWDKKKSRNGKNERFLAETEHPVPVWRGRHPDTAERSELTFHNKLVVFVIPPPPVMCQARGARRAACRAHRVLLASGSHSWIVLMRLYRTNIRTVLFRSQSSRQTHSHVVWLKAGVNLCFPPIFCVMALYCTEMEWPTCLFFSPAQKIDPKLDEFFQTLRRKVKIGIVGGSDYPKIAEQLGEGDDGEHSSNCLKPLGC